MVTQAGAVTDVVSIYRQMQAIAAKIASDTSTAPMRFTTNNADGALIKPETLAPQLNALTALAVSTYSLVIPNYPYNAVAGDMADSDKLARSMAVLQQSLLGSGVFIPAQIVIQGDSPVINYILGPASLAGVTNSSKGSVSFWFKPTYNNTVDCAVLRLSGSTVTIQTGVDQRMLVQIISSGGTTNWWSAVIEPATTESHYAISWDVNFAAGLKQLQLYRNGVPDMTVVYQGDPAGTVTLTGQPSLGADSAGNFIATGTYREVMYWPGVQIDWATTISKVYAAGLAVDPGPTGSLVTGSVPAVYLSLRGSASASTFLTNKGTGGNFTVRTGQPMVRADMPVLGYGDSLMFGTSSSAYPSKTWMWLTCVGLNTPRQDINYGVGGQTTNYILNTELIPSLAPNFAAYGSNPIWILQGGYNDLAGSSATIIANLSAMVTNLLATDPNAKWIMMGITNSNVAAELPGGAKYITLTNVNNAMAAAYGSHFLDVKSGLISRGIALSSPPSAPTAQDLIDIANDCVPTSLRPVDVHWNDYGEIAVSKLMIERIQLLGYD